MLLFTWIDPNLFRITKTNFYISICFFFQSTTFKLSTEWTHDFMVLALSSPILPETPVIHSIKVLFFSLPPFWPEKDRNISLSLSLFSKQVNVIQGHS